MSIQYIIVTNHSAGHIVGYQEITVSLPFSYVILFRVKLEVTELRPKLTTQPFRHRYFTDIIY